MDATGGPPEGEDHVLGEPILLGRKLRYCSVVLLTLLLLLSNPLPPSSLDSPLDLSLPPSSHPSICLSLPHLTHLSVSPSLVSPIYLSLPPSSHPSSLFLPLSLALISPSLPACLRLAAVQMSSRQGVESSLRQLEMERALLQHQNTESLRKADSEMERKRSLENEREPLPLWRPVCFYSWVFIRVFFMGFWAFLRAARRDREGG